MAFRLLLDDGYAATTVDAIARAGGVARITVFRYFGSKAGIVWGEFDRAVERLDAALAARAEHPTIEAVRDAIVESTSLSREAAPDTWLDRFRVIDRDPALVSENSLHWRIWAERIAEFVVMRSGDDADPAVAAAVGAAFQAAYVVVLREWAASDAPVVVDGLAARLDPLCGALRALVVR